MKESPSDNAETMREVNAHIRVAAELLAVEGDEQTEYRFFCECGCMETVTMTLAAHAASGAWSVGHKPE